VTHQGDQPLAYGENQILTVQEHGTWHDGTLSGTLTFETVSTKHRNLSFVLHCVAPWGEISYSTPIEVKTSRKRISSLEDPLPSGRPDWDRASLTPRTASQPELPGQVCDFLWLEPIFDIVTSIRDTKDVYRATNGPDIFRMIRDEWLEQMQMALKSLEPSLPWDGLDERTHEVWRDNIRYLRELHSTNGQSEQSAATISPTMHAPYEGGSGWVCTGLPATEKLLTNRTYHYQFELKEAEDTAILSSLRAGDPLQCHLMCMGSSSDACSYFPCPLPNPLHEIPTTASSTVSPVTVISNTSLETCWDGEDLDDEDALWMETIVAQNGENSLPAAVLTETDLPESRPTQRTCNMRAEVFSVEQRKVTVSVRYHVVSQSFNDSEFIPILQWSSNMDYSILPPVFLVKKVESSRRKRRSRKNYSSQWNFESVLPKTPVFWQLQFFHQLGMIQTATCAQGLSQGNSLFISHPLTSTECHRISLALCDIASIILDWC
jgi:hypothetical protein